MAARSLVDRLRDLAQKWTQRASAAQQDYVREISRPDTWQRWQQNAAAAAQTYNQAMQEVINENRWGNVMANIDPRVYGEMTRAKADRRVQGIQIATNRWQAGFQPIAEAIDRVRATLPPRGPKMSDQNIQRFLAVIRAIHEAARARRGMRAAGGAAAGPITTPAFGGGLPPVSMPQTQPATTQTFQTQAPSTPRLGSYLSGGALW